MTITEILTEIHKQRVELEVCQELQRWLLNENAKWANKAIDHEKTIQAILDIATENQTNSLDEIMSICNFTLNDE